MLQVSEVRKRLVQSSGKRVSPEQPVCDKGRKFIASAQSRAFMAKKRAEKRDKHTSDTEASSGSAGLASRTTQKPTGCGAGDRPKQQDNVGSDASHQELRPVLGRDVDALREHGTQGEVSSGLLQHHDNAGRPVALVAGECGDSGVVFGAGETRQKIVMLNMEENNEKEGVADHMVEQRFLLDLRPENGKAPMTAKALAAICSSLETVNYKDTEWVAVPGENKIGTIMFEQWRYI